MNALESSFTPALRHEKVCSDAGRLRFGTLRLGSGLLAIIQVSTSVITVLLYLTKVKKNPKKLAA